VILPGERTRGFILLGVAAVMLTAGLLIGWGGITRWRAITAVQRYHMDLLGSKDDAARTSAKEAAALLPNDAATALAAIDPAADGADDRLERLARAVPPRQRPLVASTRSFAAVLAGKPAGDGAEGADAALLKHLVALASGELAPFPELRQGDPPAMAILSRTAQAHAQAAWNAGKPAELRAALGILALLRPQHAEIVQIKAVLAAVDPDCDAVRVLDAFTQLGDRQTAWARRLALLAPARARLFIGRIPADQRTGEENQQMQVGAAQDDLQQVVDRALASPGEAAVVMAFIRCTQESRLDLAAKLVEKAPEGTRQDLQLALAYQQGDFRTVAKLDPTRTDLKPAITTPLGRPGFISFHLSTPAGLVPVVGGLDVRLDGQRVAPDRLKRWGSLILVEFRGAGEMTLEVRIGDVLVFNGKVSA
jgi:hypothetical protein